MLTYDISNCCKILKLSKNMVENSERTEAETHQDYLLKLLRLEIEHRGGNQAGKTHKRS